MRITITKDIDIAHDGINITTYAADSTHDLPDAWANRLIEIGAAKGADKPVKGAAETVEVAEKSPVEENKAIEAAPENKGKKGKR